MNLPATLDLLPSATLEELLTAATKYGKHSLSYMGDGWYFRIDMYVASEGAEFKVSSDFKMPTAVHAVRQSLQRVATTLGKLK